MEMVFDKLQSGFRDQHRSESALLNESNDLFLTVTSGKCEILALIDLTAAFDTIMNDIL